MGSLKQRQSWPDGAASGAAKSDSDRRRANGQNAQLAHGSGSEHVDRGWLALAAVKLLAGTGGRMWSGSWRKTGGLGPVTRTPPSSARPVPTSLRGSGLLLPRSSSQLLPEPGRCSAVARIGGGLVVMESMLLALAVGPKSGPDLSFSLVIVFLSSVYGRAVSIDRYCEPPERGAWRAAAPKAKQSDRPPAAPAAPAGRAATQTRRHVCTHHDSHLPAPTYGQDRRGPIHPALSNFHINIGVALDPIG
ncbi:hypothetical protein PG993_004529 [Apiospora rasikravindrae]|uniref:Uncharacterized protein n=1 Tax=Apiospora rasikravindrae TaxID=990691 RepID=A0ABR1TCZ1_9PEZI